MFKNLTKEPKTNFGYKIIETLSIEEGIKHILSIPLKKWESLNSSRKYILAEMAKTNVKCVCCGAVGAKFCLGLHTDNSKHWDLYTENDIALSVDHIIPKANGGADNIGNTQIMCVRCNWFKGHEPDRLIPYRILLNAGLEVYPIHAKPCYFKIGYWKRLDLKTFNLIKEYVTEEEFYDEECGYLYAYNLKK